VHDGIVGLDGPSVDCVAILEVDDDHLGRRCLVLLVSDADVVVGLYCLEGRRSCQRRLSRCQRGERESECVWACQDTTYARVEADGLLLHANLSELDQFRKLDRQWSRHVDLVAP
jgi:hypothetical protein